MCEGVKERVGYLLFPATWDQLTMRQTLGNPSFNPLVTGQHVPLGIRPFGGAHPPSHHLLHGHGVVEVQAAVEVSVADVLHELRYLHGERQVSVSAVTSSL